MQLLSFITYNITKKYDESEYALKVAKELGPYLREILKETLNSVAKIHNPDGNNKHIHIYPVLCLFDFCLSFICISINIA